MNIEKRQVSTTAELLAATADADVRHIVIAASINDMPTLRLLNGQTLTGSDLESVLSFAAGEHGLQLSADNQVESLQLVADPDKRVVFNDTSVERLGHLVLRNLRVTGVVQLLGRVDGFATNWIGVFPTRVIGDS